MTVAYGTAYVRSATYGPSASIVAYHLADRDAAQLWSGGLVNTTMSSASDCTVKPCWAICTSRMRSR